MNGGRQRLAGLFKRTGLRTLDRALATRGWRVARRVPEGVDDGYLHRTHDDNHPLPGGAEDYLQPDHPRLSDLRARYAALDWPVVVHSRWGESVTREWLDLRWFRGDYAYVWHYRESRRVSELKYLLWLDHVAGRDERDLLNRLDEDGAFGCWTHRFPERPVVSRDLLDAVSELGFLDRHVDLLTRPGIRVLDIGAGYGRLAHRAAVGAPALGRWACTDAVPESTFLCEYYTGFRGVRPPVDVVPLDEVPELEPHSFDLAVNVHSWSECTRSAISWWVDHLARLAVPQLFVVPNEPEGFASTEVDGGSLDYLPVLQNAGYTLVAEEKVITDPAVRTLLAVEDRYCLFERR